MTQDGREKTNPLTQGWSYFVFQFLYLIPVSNTRFIGESFPWLNAAPKHRLWAEGMAEQCSTMEDMKEKWGFSEK